MTKRGAEMAEDVSSIAEQLPSIYESLIHSQVSKKKKKKRKKERKKEKKKKFWAKIQKYRHVTEDLRWLSKHMERCPAPWVSREMQIKTMKYLYLPMGMTKIQIPNSNKCW
jgi:protein subunit release factor A